MNYGYRSTLTLCSLVTVAGALAQQTVALPSMKPRSYHPKLSEFRMPVADIIPETQSSQNAVTSDTVSALPNGEGVDRIVAPPLVAVLQQKIGVRDAATGQSYINGITKDGFERIGSTEATWEPGKWTVAMRGRLLSLEVQQVALNHPQGLIEKIKVRNKSSIPRTVELFSVQEPSGLPEFLNHVAC